MVARIDLNDDQVEKLIEWCAADLPISRMMASFGIKSYTPLRRAISIHCPEYVISGKYRGPRSQIGIKKNPGGGGLPCVPDCDCGRHYTSDHTRALLRRPKKRRAGENGCWATRAEDYRRTRSAHSCDICGKPELVGAKRHHVDHCHDADVIRGLLCNGCNLHLGRWEPIASFFSGDGWTDTPFDYKRDQRVIDLYRKTLTITDCNCCGLPEFAVSKVKHHIDHNPETGKIRGVLCITCSVTLGWYERNAAAVESYLQGVMPI